MIVVAVALAVLNITPQPAAISNALEILVDVAAMVAAVVRAVRLLTVTGSSCSTRNVCGHSFCARGAVAEHRSTLAMWPHTHNAIAEAQNLVHLTCLLYGHGVTSSGFETSVWDGSFSISPAAHRCFADDVGTWSNFDVLKCRGSHSVEKLMQHN